MELERFQSLPVEEVARLVRADGPKVCVFPINGTRRWFMLEHPEEAVQDFMSAYFEIGGRGMIEAFKLFFDHGLDTLLSPIFGLDLLKRGEEYAQLALEGLLWFTENQDFLDFYNAYDVRVRVYGDAHRYLKGASGARVLDAFERVERYTQGHERYRLFFGVCAHDATESVAEIGIRFYQGHHRPPNRREIVSAYYGEYVEPVDLFIGFERPSAFDMPLLATGAEDLYFTLSPSLYVDESLLRSILHDHIYARRLNEADYTGLSQEAWEAQEAFYKLNRRAVLGLGRRHPSGCFWYPLPQVKLPSELLKVTKSK